MRFRPDATILSEIDLDAPPSPLGKGNLDDIFFDGIGSGVGVGSIRLHGTYKNHFYMAKYEDLGIPFVPWITNLANERKEYSGHQPFPNPGSNSLCFTNIFEPYFLTLVDSQGKIVLSNTFQPLNSIATSNLPSGLYHYSLSLNSKVLRGMWVKN
jgi:hypothetical protein